MGLSPSTIRTDGNVPIHQVGSMALPSTVRSRPLRFTQGSIDFDCVPIGLNTRLRWKRPHSSCDRGPPRHGPHEYGDSSSSIRTLRSLSGAGEGHRSDNAAGRERLLFSAGGCRALNPRTANYRITSGPFEKGVNSQRSEVACDELLGRIDNRSSRVAKRFPLSRAIRVQVAVDFSQRVYGPTAAVA